MYTRLQAYQEEHNSCDVPQRYPQDPQLGKWVSYQRHHHKKLTKEQCDQLEAIGFQWRSSYQTFKNQWTKMYTRLQAYQQEHNSCEGMFKETSLRRRYCWTCLLVQEK